MRAACEIARLCGRGSLALAPWLLREHIAAKLFKRLQMYVGVDPAAAFGALRANLREHGRSRCNKGRGHASAQ